MLPVSEKPGVIKSQGISSPSHFAPWSSGVSPDCSASLWGPPIPTLTTRPGLELAGLQGWTCDPGLAYQSSLALQT